ncbi:MAG: sugar phosphate isomerase/epimerase [Anaerolineae bacterium]|nr:sugar phosphate isomerase/epimerase [Anaerolineae bacterium]
MKLSIVSSVFVNFALPDAARSVCDLGVPGMDIWAGRPHAYRQDYSPAQLRDIRRLLEDRGVHAVSLMPAFFRYPHSLSNPNPLVRQDTLDYMRACMDNAITLGAGILLIVPGFSLHGQAVEDARARLTESIDLVCQAAEGYPIKLGIEPANASVTDLIVTADDAMHIIHALGHDNLGVVMDTGHMHLNRERIEDVLALVGDRLLQFHVNDNDGQRQQNAIPGEGTCDFTHFIDVLRARAYNGFLSIELGYDYTRDPITALGKSAAYMRRLIETP